MCTTWIAVMLYALYSVKRFTGKEMGRNSPAGVQSPTSTGKHKHHPKNPKPPTHRPRHRKDTTRAPTAPPPNDQHAGRPRPPQNQQHQGKPEA